MSESEKSLLKKAKSGDVEAFEKLIEEHQGKVFNIAYRMIGNFDDAHDMAQEVFIRVYRSLATFKEQASFSTWIYRITKNVCLDELRKRKNKNILYIDEDIKLDEGDISRQLESQDETPEIQLERKELKSTIKKAIDALQHDHRLVVILRDIQGFSYEEISKILDCPEGTVKSRINRARKSLRDILKSNGELLAPQFVK